MRNRTQISEAQLRNIIHNVIMEEVQAQELEEGWLQDKWNQGKTAVNSFMGNSPTKKNVTKGDGTTMNLKGRFNAGKQNWKLQGQQNNIQNALQQIVDICKRYNIPTNKTIDELSQFGGGMQQRMASMSSQMKNNVQNIYRN